MKTKKVNVVVGIPADCEVAGEGFFHRSNFGKGNDGTVDISIPVVKKDIPKQNEIVIGVDKNGITYVGFSTAQISIEGRLRINFAKDPDSRYVHLTTWKRAYDLKPVGEGTFYRNENGAVRIEDLELDPDLASVKVPQVNLVLCQRIEE